MVVDIEDIHSLRVFLRDRGKIQPGETCRMQVLHGGISNKTVLFTRESGEQWVIKQALSKLRVRQEWFCDPGRLEVEFNGMKWLCAVLPEGSVPKPVFFDAAGHVLAMQAIAQPHDNLKSVLLEGKIHLEWIGKLGKLLAMIHLAGWESTEAENLFGDRSFFKSLRLEPYYRFTSGQLPGSASFFNRLIEENLSISQTVVHGDFSPKNVLVKDDRLILLDHEVMHYGDAAFDTGFCLCHFLSKANYLYRVRDDFIGAAHLFWNSYLQMNKNVDQGMEKRIVGHAIGCLLSRVKGRSPLEYLSMENQKQQVRIGMKLMGLSVSEVSVFIDMFKMELNKTGES